MTFKLNPSGMHQVLLQPCLLLGSEFNLVTVNKPDTYLDSQPCLSRRQARWSEYLLRFHFNWMHKPGKFNVADPLSRNPSFPNCLGDFGSDYPKPFKDCGNCQQICV